MTHTVRSQLTPPFRLDTGYGHGLKETGCSSPIIMEKAGRQVQGESKGDIFSDVFSYDFLSQRE